MNPVVVVRRFEDQDERRVQEIIRAYVLSKFKDAFWFCLFREITLQLVVLSTAIFFIFFGVPLLFCVSSVPIVVVLLALCVYFAHYNKAIELSMMHSPICFVAEVYEPYILRLNKKEIEYTQMSDDEVKGAEEMKKLKKTIIGTISIKNHNSLHDSAWLHRLAVDPDYPFARIAIPLIESAMKHAYEYRMYTCETVSSECHEELREVLLKVGFMIKQIYHKSIVGSSLRVMKAQMGIDLEKYFRNQRRNTLDVTN